MKQNDIIVTDYKGACFVSVKYERYEIVDTDNGAYIVGRGEKREDRIRGYDKTALVSLLNLCETLQQKAPGQNTVNQWSKESSAELTRFAVDLIQNGASGAGYYNRIVHDPVCREAVVDWCRRYGLPFEEESPGLGSSLEGFIFSLFKLSHDFSGYQEACFSGVAYKYITSGTMRYDLDIVDGTPKMTIIFRSIIELAHIQLALSAINVTGNDVMVQCQCCGRWFVGNSRMKYCQNPCTKESAYKKRKAGPKRPAPEGLLHYTVKRGKTND